MTNRTTDIHCDRCRRYMHSLWPREPIPDVNLCDRCSPTMKDCGEAGHAEGRCGNAQCLPGTAGVKEVPHG